jgi:hypothetical protein
VLGARILGAQGYYTATQILEQITEVTGKKTQFMQIEGDVYKSFLPEFMAQEMLENHLLIENPGYYGGEGLEKSQGIVEEGLVSWREYVEKGEVFKG